MASTRSFFIHDSSTIPCSSKMFIHFLICLNWVHLKFFPPKSLFSTFRVALSFLICGKWEFSKLFKIAVASSFSPRLLRLCFDFIVENQKFCESVAFRWILLIGILLIKYACKLSFVTWKLLKKIVTTAD